jgi:hypothetical protein
VRHAALAEIPVGFVERLKSLGPRFIRLASRSEHPKKILETLGHSLTILPDMNAAVLYSTGADPEIVAKSVEVILQDLRIRIESNRTK